MSDCLFCKIVAGESPATVVAEGAEWLAFETIDPQAPVHVLVIPRRHVADIGELAADPAVAAAVVAGVKDTAKKVGLSSYRTVFNSGPDAGQTIFHVHAHVLGGRYLEWPPG